MSDFIAYYRVSTLGQGRSGLGLEAQKEAVRAYVASIGGRVVGEYRDIESGANNQRIELNAAIRQCRSQKAMLVIAKLDRLARSVSFISQLLDSGVEFVAADIPYANKLTIHIIAAVAEYEREAISARTKASLAAAKARGVKLGNPNVAALSKSAAAVTTTNANDFAQALMPVINALRSNGATSLQRLAKALETQRIPTQRGGRWSAAGVRNILQRADDLEQRWNHDSVRSVRDETTGSPR